jgi:hypothetical protein
VAGRVRQGKADREQAGDFRGGQRDYPGAGWWRLVRGDWWRSLGIGTVAAEGDDGGADRQGGAWNACGDQVSIDFAGQECDFTTSENGFLRASYYVHQRAAPARIPAGQHTVPSWILTTETLCRPS